MPHRSFRAHARSSPATSKVGSPGVGMSRRHHNQFPFGGHFEVQIGMFGAKDRELLIAHGRSRQGRGQEGFSMRNAMTSV